MTDGLAALRQRLVASAPFVRQPRYDEGFRDGVDATLAALEQVGSSPFCPVHGSASCPEEYMLNPNGKSRPGYEWDESMRCGQRPTSPLYRAITPDTEGEGR